MKNYVFSAGLFSLLAITSAGVSAQELSIKVTNLTKGTYFTPLLIAAHNNKTDLFELGVPASQHLQAMAEVGDINGLVNDVANAGANYVANPAAGLLAPRSAGVRSCHLSLHMVMAKNKT